MRDNKQDEKNQIRGDQPLDYPNWQKEYQIDIYYYEGLFCDSSLFLFRYILKRLE